MSLSSSDQISFQELALIQPVLEALSHLGYERPSPIQAQVIPHVMAGRDVVGQAQTGTGKTAAFAMPILSRIDLKSRKTQALILTPTRELAIQVSESFMSYGAGMKDLGVLAVYGGQEYGVQLRQLKRGVQVVVGTPGRIMDHIRRGSLSLASLTSLVLDEADEMLRMGFIDDVEWIIEQTPATRQIALFSATMPVSIRKIAYKHLVDPQEVTIKSATSTVKTIRQRYLQVSENKKYDALTRLLEAEEVDGMLVFVRTKTSAMELAERLESQGFAATCLHGDIAQQQRERTVEQFKTGKFNVLVATDVAARGLDVERVSHVINYDVPYDSESYVHRIGRTGRAGRSGEAILFITPRERRLLVTIERATRQKIEMMAMPSVKAVNERRIVRFKQRVTDILAREEHTFFKELLQQYQEERNVGLLDIAAALARIVQGDKPLLLSEESETEKRALEKNVGQEREYRGREREPRKGVKPYRPASRAEQGMERFRVEIGHNHGVRPGNIVGAIAGETGIGAEFIGRINIFDEYSTVDLPGGMPSDTLRILQKAWISGRQLQITRFDQQGRVAREGGVDRKSDRRAGKMENRKGGVVKRTGKSGMKTRSVHSPESRWQGV